MYQEIELDQTSSFEMIARELKRKMEAIISMWAGFEVFEKYFDQELEQDFLPDVVPVCENAGSVVELQSLAKTDEILEEEEALEKLPPNYVFKFQEEEQLSESNFTYYQAHWDNRFKTVKEKIVEERFPEIDDPSVLVEKSGKEQGQSFVPSREVLDRDHIEASKHVKKGIWKMQRLLFDPGIDLNVWHGNMDIALDVSRFRGLKIIVGNTGCRASVYKSEDNSINLNCSKLVDIVALGAEKNNGMRSIMDFPENGKPLPYVPRVSQKWLIVRVGEGTFGEAYRVGENICKIVPFGGELKVNRKVQKRPKELLEETHLSCTLNHFSKQDGNALNSGSTFTETKEIRVCQGPYDHVFKKCRYKTSRFIFDPGGKTGCIFFGKEDASVQDVVAATKALNSHNFISRLPEAYDAQVGERGI